jgi:tetratricopeptide (TPR) repeat protein
MKREEFLACLREPAALPPSSTRELEDIVRMYPYFQGGHILYALSLHQSKEIRFPEALKNAALHAGDRRQLYNLIHFPKKGVEIRKTDQEKIAEAPEKTASFGENAIQPSEEFVLEEQSNSEKSEGSSLMEEVQISTSMIEVESGDSEITEASVSAFEATPPPVEADIIAQILVYPEINKPELEEKSLEQNPPIEQTSPLKEETTETGASISDSGKRSFSDWLKRIQPNTQDHPLPQVAESTQKEEAAKESEAPNHLIERFIQTEPRISKPVKAEFFSPVQMAKKSIEDNEDIVSETLARIYADQGNIDRAIRIYQKLSLLNPEKNGYFAALIQNLENPELL